MKIGTRCEFGDGVPIRVVVELVSPVVIHKPIAFDSLLMAAQALAHDLPPLPQQDPPVEVMIPICQHDGIYLASWALFDVEAVRTANRTRPIPMRQILDLCSSKRKYNVVSGPGKPTRIPEERKLIRRMTWFVLGDLSRIEDLVRTITAVGSRRGAGMGQVRRWMVTQCDYWEGFPVALEGAPLRSLPIRWPKITSGRRSTGRLIPPYWSGDRVPIVEPAQ